MTLPEGRAPIDRDDLAKLAGHPSTYKAEIEILKAKLARAEARKPVVKALPWVDFEGRGAKAQAWLEASYLITKWSTGKFEACASYPGHQGQRIGAGFFDTLDEAKAACQADYQDKIQSAIEWKESE